MTMASSPILRIGDVARADFRTSRDADAGNSDLQRSLELLYRYQPARIAIGRSLGEPAPPAPSTDLLGKPIKGDTLFGQDEADVALWASLVVEHHGRSLSRKEFQELVGAHWSRGITLLRADMARVDDGPELIRSLMSGVRVPVP